MSTQQEKRKNTPRLVQALKEMGYKINNIVHLVGISRAHFYKKADNPPLALLQALRGVTAPKLDEYFPELKATPYQVPAWRGIGYQVGEYDPNYKPSEITEEKYQQLSKEYNDLLASYAHLTQLLIRAANNNSKKDLRQAISDFLDKRKK